MSRHSRLRLTVFEAVLFLMVLAIGWAALRAFRIVRQVDHIPVTFQKMPEAYFRIADRLEPAVNDLNEALTHFTARHDRADWDRFLRKGQELKQWINDEKTSSLKTKVTMLQPVQVTTDIGALLEQIGAASEAYLAEARKATREGAQT